MSLYGDPDELDRLADQLRRRAEEVRRHAADHVRAGEAARWVSSAAVAFRDCVAQDRVEADRAAAELERAAHLLHAHAREVRETIAAIARFEEEVTAWFGRQARVLATTVEHAVDATGEAVRAVVREAPWHHWPVGPQNLPAPGHAGWLEVGRFMQAQGVL